MTETVNVDGAVPLLGVTDSHEALSCAVQVNDPPPVFVMETLFDAGLLPNRVAEKLSEVGLTPMAGGGAEIVRVTGIV